MTSGIERVSFEKGLCNFCRQEFPLISSQHKEKCLKDFYQTIERLKEYQGEYNCMVAFSGGKDSAYLLYILKYEYGLRPLAVTVDTGFLNPNAHDNIARVTKKLHIDHTFIKPNQELFNSLYRYFLNNLAKLSHGRNVVYDMCALCTHIMDICMLKLAVEKRIPVLFIGLSPDEIRMVLRIYGPDIAEHFYESAPYNIIEEKNAPLKCAEILNADLLKEIHLPVASEGMPRVIFPFHVLPYDPEKFRQFLDEKGIIPKEKSSPYASNCQMNWIMIYAFMKKFKYNPYIEMFSDIVRQKPELRASYIWIDNYIKLAIKFGLFKNKEINNILKELKLDKKDIL